MASTSTAAKALPTLHPGACEDTASRSGRQVRRAPQPARRVGAADARRARLRAHQPARDREQLRVQPRRRALLLLRQDRADRLLRALLQGPVRTPLRRRGRRLDLARGAPRLLRREAGGDPPGRGSDAPALVRPAHAEHVRRDPARGRADDRPDAGGHDLAGHLPLRRAQRSGGRDDPVGGVRRARRAVPAGAPRLPHRGPAGDAGHPDRPGARPDAAHPQQAEARSPRDGAAVSIRRSRSRAPAPRAPPADAGSAARRSADLRSARSGWHRARAA